MLRIWPRKCWKCKVSIACGNRSKAAQLTKGNQQLAALEKVEAEKQALAKRVANSTADMEASSDDAEGSNDASPVTVSGKTKKSDSIPRPTGSNRELQHSRCNGVRWKCEEAGEVQLNSRMFFLDNLELCLNQLWSSARLRSLLGMHD